MPPNAVVRCFYNSNHYVNMYFARIVNTSAVTRTDSTHPRLQPLKRPQKSVTYLPMYQI